jgi:sugar phosphate permease
MASGVGPMLMRYVDHVAKETSLGLGTMFIFAAFLQLVASYFACQLPKDKTNSKNLERHEHLAEKEDEELAEL